MTGTAFKAEATAGAGGRVAFDLPLPPGTTIEVIIFVPPADTFSDLVAATGSVTGFWDNPLDDEDWNAPQQGDIVLVPVPFTDLTSHCRRPVIVISQDAYQQATQNFVCVAMTSNLKDEPYSFEITSADLAEGTLNRPGRVRADKVFTLAQAIIVNKFGRMDQATLDRVRQLLTDLVR